MGKQRRLTGKIVIGVGQGAFFTGLDWFQEQCQEKLGFKPHPGTLNIKISTDSVPIIEKLENAGGPEFIPPDANFCSGKAFPVSIAGVRGAPESCRYPIGLVRVEQVGTNLGRLAETKRQHPCRRRIQTSRMTGLLRVEQPFYCL